MTPAHAARRPGTPAAATLLLRPRRAVRWLAAIALLLVLASVVVHVVAFWSGHDHMLGVRRLFDLDGESNLPALYASLLLLCVAFLLAAIGRARAAALPAAHQWYTLAAIATLLAVDEATSIHEMAIAPMRSALGSDAPLLLHYAWVVPGALLAAAFVLVFWRFQSRLPQPLRWRARLAGVLYLGGALGVELPAGRHVALYGADTLAYAAGLVTVEEGLEFAGVLLLMHGLVAQLAAVAPEWRITLAAPVPRRFRPHPLVRPVALPGRLGAAAPRVALRAGGLRPPTLQ